MFTLLALGKIPEEEPTFQVPLELPLTFVSPPHPRFLKLFLPCGLDPNILSGVSFFLKSTFSVEEEFARATEYFPTSLLKQIAQNKYCHSPAFLLNIIFNKKKNCIEPFCK